jgi:CelD/BcsL family acetyltransferase involved in cellulose biosynthesis
MSLYTQLAIDWELDEATWSEALSHCPGATYYHTNAWLTSVSRAFASRAIRARVNLGPDRWALLPLSIRPLARGWVPLAVAGEAGVYGGLVAPTPLSDQEVEQIYDAVRRRFPDLQVVGNPFATGPHLPLGGGVQSASESTHLLKLAPFAELRAGFSRGAKSRGNKARKHGYELVVTSDQSGVEAFYPLYEDSMRRWGDKLTWPRPRAFFETMLQHGAPDVCFYLALKDGEPVSAILMAAHGAAAHYIAGATRHDHLDASPSNFLMEEALTRYADAGFSFFDFGPSNGLAGVIQFKESFGARPAPFHSMASRTLAGRAYFALRAPFVRMGVWRQQFRRNVSIRASQSAA